MSLNDIYMLALDHSVEFDDTFAAGATPTATEVELIRHAKKLIFKGLQQAATDGVPLRNAAILADQQYGAAVLDAARDSGMSYSMSVNSPTGGPTLAEGWRESLKRYRPTWAKPLLWYNVEGDKDKNRRQIESVRVLQEWLHSNDQQMLLELLIPAEQHQIEATAGSTDQYQAKYLPKLIAAAMIEICTADIRPAVWKIQGVPTLEGTKVIGDAAAVTGAECLVLGHGADAETVGQWLTLAATTDGYRGFAIGRTIWRQPVIDWKRDRDDDRLVVETSQRYRQSVNAYHRAP